MTNGLFYTSISLLDNVNGSSINEDGECWVGGNKVYYTSETTLTSSYNQHGSSFWRMKYYNCDIDEYKKLLGPRGSDYNKTGTDVIDTVASAIFIINPPQPEKDV